MKTKKTKKIATAHVYYNRMLGKQWDEGEGESDASLVLLYLFAKKHGLEPSYFMDDGGVQSMPRREDFFDLIRKQNLIRPKTLKIGIVIVLELSHILRPGEDRWDLMHFFLHHGVHFFSIKDGLDSLSSVTRFNYIPRDFKRNPFETRSTTNAEKQTTEGKKQATDVKKISVWKNRLGGDDNPLLPPSTWSLN